MEYSFLFPLMQKLWKSIKKCKTYSRKATGLFFLPDTVYVCGPFYTAAADDSEAEWLLLMCQVSQYTFAMCSYRERKHDPTDILQLDGHTVDYCDPLEGQLSIVICKTIWFIDCYSASTNSYIIDSTFVYYCARFIKLLTYLYVRRVSRKKIKIFFTTIPTNVDQSLWKLANTFVYGLPKLIKV